MSLQLNNTNNKLSQGFTLVELSIVLIIIGFILAGLAAGSSLIKSAQLNSVITDFTNNLTAYENFLGRYRRVPGDYNNAYAIWADKCGPSGVSQNGSPITCNGNGNGTIDNANEVQAAWVMLYQANMINTAVQAVGFNPATSSQGSILLAAAPGKNMPLSKVPGAGYMMAQGAEYLAGSAQIFVNNTALWAQGSGNTTPINAVFLAKPDGTSSTLLNSAIAPSDAYTIDSKVDDGIAATGSIRAANGNDAGNGSSSCLGAQNGNYNLNNTLVSCVIGQALNQ